jgi:hypothetical protein
LLLQTTGQIGKIWRQKDDFDRKIRALLFLDQIKREKGVWWMPWQ